MPERIAAYLGTQAQESLERAVNYSVDIGTDFMAALSNLPPSPEIEAAIRELRLKECRVILSQALMVLVIRGVLPVAMYYLCINKKYGLNGITIGGEIYEYDDSARLGLKVAMLLCSFKEAPSLVSYAVEKMVKSLHNAIKDELYLEGREIVNKDKDKEKTH